MSLQGYFYLAFSIYFAAITPPALYFLYAILKELRKMNEYGRHIQ